MNPAWIILVFIQSRHKLRLKILFCMEGGAHTSKRPWSPEIRNATEPSLSLAGTSCCSGKRLATPDVGGPGRGLGSSPTVPALRSTALSSFSAAAPNCPDPFSPKPPRLTGNLPPQGLGSHRIREWGAVCKCETEGTSLILVLTLKIALCFYVVPAES